MPRVRNGVAKNRKRKRLMRRVKGFRGGRGKLLRTAKETRIRAEVFATKHRRKKKGDWRGLWIIRINAACRARGINYSKFMLGLRRANVELNRKMLADLALRDSSGFDNLVLAAKSALGDSTPGDSAPGR
ncbi:MAG TPA: 50S ribosomal protein L20 [Planctomycetota bacterium]|nr:50S ribosomal protein L20 [Planctomycetota bacterium]